MFRTPMKVMNFFSTKGANGLIDTFLKADQPLADTFNTAFAMQVAAYRDDKVGTPKVQMLIDIMWGTWSGAYDEEFT